MNEKTPSGKVLPFRRDDRKKSLTPKAGTETWDQGPSPEESLRVMRAFVAIKDKALRKNLTEMLENASRVRGQIPSPAKE